MYATFMKRLATISAILNIFCVTLNIFFRQFGLGVFNATMLYINLSLYQYWKEKEENS